MSSFVFDQQEEIFISIALAKLDINERRTDFWKS